MDTIVMCLALCSGSLDECNSVIGMATAAIATALPSLDACAAKRYAAACGGARCSMHYLSLVDLGALSDFGAYTCTHSFL